MVSVSLVAGCTPEGTQQVGPPSLPEVLPREAEIGDAGWTIPVPGGAHIFEYPVVSLEDREGDEIALVEDLRIGAEENDSSPLFNRPRDIAVDDQGRIYASDGADGRVLVFDSGGGYLQTLGSRGQGPGEYEWPTALALAGDWIAVSDASSRTITVWNLDGELRSERRFDFNGQVFHMYGLSNGSVIGSFRLWESPFRVAIARINLDGEEELRIGSLREGKPPGISRRSGSGTVSAYLPVATAQSWFVAARNGNVFLTAGDEYQVLSIGPSGEARWALRIPWKRERVTQDEIEAALEPHQATYSTEALAKVRWPEVRPALAGWPQYLQSDRPLQLDGHGHLYVFPYFPMAWKRDDRLRPVDVYSADGALVFTGMIPNRDWVTAKGDHVYGFEQNDESNYELVRYRLTEPF